jgi:hypothetical protein
MRRAERAIYLLFAAGFTPFAEALAGPKWPLALRQAPMLPVMTLIAVVANVSVVFRLRAIMRALRARDAERAALARVGGGQSAAGAPVGTLLEDDRYVEDLKAHP